MLAGSFELANGAGRIQDRAASMLHDVGGGGEEDRVGEGTSCENSAREDLLTMFPSSTWLARFKFVIAPPARRDLGPALLDCPPTFADDSAASRAFRIGSSAGAESLEGE